MTVPVSIIMAFKDRPTFRNTLIGWSNLDYPDYEFIFIDDGSKDIGYGKKLISEFSNGRNVKYLCFDAVRNINIAWNTGYKEATGDFIIFTMQDEIISNKQILHHMINEYDGNRINVLPYYLSRTMTDIIDAVDWRHNPELIETLSEFWTSRETLNFTRTSAGVLSNITGQYRKDWDWFGLFRNHEDGYLWIDQDVAMREACLKRPAKTAQGVKCYHQYHNDHVVGVNRNGYIYHTEREARLLDPATVAV